MESLGNQISLYFSMYGFKVLGAIIILILGRIAAGIGLFITFIGFQHGSLIISKPGTMVGLNTHFISSDIAVLFFGLIIISVLKVKKIKGAIIIGILSSAFLAYALGKISFDGILGLPQINEQIAFRMDIKTALSLTCLPFIIVFVFMDMFDTVGTLMGVAETAGFVKIHVKKGGDRIIGGTIVAENAGDMIGSLSIAMTNRIGLGKIANSIHPYPTQAEAIRKVGDLYNRTRLTPAVKAIFTKWLAWSR